jgi:hypothetical protein
MPRPWACLALAAALLAASFATVDFAALADADPTYADEPSMDLTVWRTVRTLSCHPQFPHVAEVPVYTAKRADGRACFSWHAQPDPDYVGKPIGKPGRTKADKRKPIPRKHYLVVEGPNLVPSPAFPGPYWHWEGLVDVFLVVIKESQNEELWYVKTFGGVLNGHQIGQDRVPIVYRTFFTAADGQQLAGAVMGDGDIHWKSCSWEAAPRRPGDEGIPCFTITAPAGRGAVGGRTWLNPWRHWDIAHDRYGHRTWAQIQDGSWAYGRVGADGLPCLAEVVAAPTWQDDGDGVFNSHEVRNAQTSRVYPLPPDGCDFAPLPADPGAPPVEGYPEGGEH